MEIEVACNQVAPPVARRRSRPGLRWRRGRHRRERGRLSRRRGQPISKPTAAPKSWFSSPCLLHRSDPPAAGGHGLTEADWNTALPTRGRRTSHTPRFRYGSRRCGRRLSTCRCTHQSRTWPDRDCRHEHTWLVHQNTVDIHGRTDGGEERRGQEGDDVRGQSGDDPQPRRPPGPRAGFGSGRSGAPRTSLFKGPISHVTYIGNTFGNHKRGLGHRIGCLVRPQRHLQPSPSLKARESQSPARGLHSARHRGTRLVGCPRTGCPPARTPSLQDDVDGYYGRLAPAVGGDERRVEPHRPRRRPRRPAGAR